MRSPAQNGKLKNGYCHRFEPSSRAGVSARLARQLALLLGPKAWKSSGPLLQVPESGPSGTTAAFNIRLRDWFR